jgi:hypothetical protein
LKIKVGCSFDAEKNIGHWYFVRWLAWGILDGLLQIKLQMYILSLCLFLCLSSYQPVCLSFSLSLCVSISLSLHLSISLCISISVSLSLLLSVSLSLCNYICRSLCLTVSLSLSISPSFYLSLYLSSSGFVISYYCFLRQSKTKEFNRLIVEVLCPIE